MGSLEIYRDLYTHHSATDYGLSGGELLAIAAAISRPERVCERSAIRPADNQPRNLFLVYCGMEPSEDQLTALGNYRDIIFQHIPEIAETVGVSVQTLKGWLEGTGEPTAEQAAEILDFLKNKGARM